MDIFIPSFFDWNKNIHLTARHKFQNHFPVRYTQYNEQGNDFEIYDERCFGDVDCQMDIFIPSFFDWNKNIHLIVINFKQFPVRYTQYNEQEMILKFMTSDVLVMLTVRWIFLFHLFDWNKI